MALQMRAQPTVLKSEGRYLASHSGRRTTELLSGDGGRIEKSHMILSKQLRSIESELARVRENGNRFRMLDIANQEET
jgi:hypothetical protein